MVGDWNASRFGIGRGFVPGFSKITSGGFYFQHKRKAGDGITGRYGFSIRRYICGWGDCIIVGNAGRIGRNVDIQNKTKIGEEMIWVTKKLIKFR